MYSVTVRGHMMIAHNLHGDVFGPAQRLHGATFVVDVEFRRSSLDANGIVLDMGRALDALNGVLSEFNYRNLDEAQEFNGRNTTTEVLARTVFDRMVVRIKSGALGTSANGIETLRVSLFESHIASASFEGPVDAGPS